MENLKELTMTLNDLALLLTVLDKEAHSAAYYAVISDEKQYIEQIRFLQRLLVAHISEEKQPAFASANPHLSGLFPDYLLSDDLTDNGWPGEKSY